MTTWELIKFPGVATVVYLYGHIMLLAFAFTAGEFTGILSSAASLRSSSTAEHFSVLPLFWFTDIKLGGFGVSPLQISLFLAVAGISQALWTLLLFPALQHRFGTGGVLRGCSIAWPITFAFWPISNLFMRHHWEVSFWVVAPVNLVLGAGVSMAFSGSSPKPLSLLLLSPLDFI